MRHQIPHLLIFGKWNYSFKVYLKGRNFGGFGGFDKTPPN